MTLRLTIFTFMSTYSTRVLEVYEVPRFGARRSGPHLHTASDPRIVGHAPVTPEGRYRSSDDAGDAMTRVTICQTVTSPVFSGLSRLQLWASTDRSTKRLRRRKTRPM